MITRDLVPRALSKPSPLPLRGKKRRELWERGGWITKGAVCLFVLLLLLLDKMLRPSFWTLNSNRVTYSKAHMAYSFSL